MLNVWNVAYFDTNILIWRTYIKTVLKTSSFRASAENAAIFTLLYLLIGAVPGLHSTAQAQQLTIAVAANFASTMKQLEPVFEAQTGYQLTISHASTGTLYAQIRNGAPFEVFLSADNKRPQQLIREGFALEDSLVTYAIGRLVLWSSNPLLINEQLIDEQLIQKQRYMLNQENQPAKDIQHIALANPKTAPYGAAAMQTLVALGLTEATKKRLVTGQNIAQAFQFVISGNAQLGFVALSQVLALPEAERGSHWQIPETLYTPIKQAAVQLNNSKDNPAAKAFLDFLTTAAATAIIQGNGYGSVSPPG